MPEALQILPFPACEFNALPPLKQSCLSKSKYDQALTDFKEQNNKEYNFNKLVYENDGLKLTGFLMRPAGEGPFPWILFNRAGNGEWGSVDLSYLNIFQTYVDAGFAVAGSQYRGADGGEGKDEYGGRDVGDILCLAELVSNLDFIQKSSLFSFGIGRGGMMTLQALKRGLPARAAAVVSGFTDLWKEASRRQEIEKHVFRSFIPDYPKNKEVSFRERSACCWAEKIKAPVLLLHGSEDSIVHHSQSEILAEKLARYGTEVSLQIVDGGDHGLSNRADFRDEEVIRWFSNHLESVTRHQVQEARTGRGIEIA